MNCPYILVTILGVHPHPVPLPLKTPPSIRKEILRLLGSVDEDLPDLTGLYKKSGEWDNAKEWDITQRVG